jgi:IS30 family transposase
MKYRRVTNEDRLRLKAFLDAEVPQAKIAGKLGFNASTISREISRNSGLRGYRIKQAQRLAEARQQYRFTPRKMTPELIRRIEDRLRLKWSPEQISNRFRHEGKPTVSAETIYKHVYADTKIGGNLWRNLRYSHRRRKRRFPRQDRRGMIQDAAPISERGRGANRRKKCGHWERDTMLGKNRKNVVLVLTDRKSRYNRFAKLKRRLAPAITKRTVKLLSGLPLRSITNDRGQEFSDHKRLAKKLEVKVFFCDPYSSYQRGTNENRIGVLRQYLPKGCDISKLHGRTLKKIEFEINNRPMRCLDWRTPYEVMFEKNCATGS